MSPAILAAFVATALAAAPVCIAAPDKVETFDQTTWARLQKELPRPAVVVFTATYCATCPALLQRMSEELRERDLKTPLVAVVIDEADPAELLASGHYEFASRLFLFEGNEAALRYQIDPRWRAVTPYVALLPEHGPAMFVAGTPTEEHLSKWSAH